MAKTKITAPVGNRTPGHRMRNSETKMMINSCPEVRGLTPWFSAFFEKFMDTQLVKQQPDPLLEPEGSLPYSQKPAT